LVVFDIEAASSADDERRPAIVQRDDSAEGCDRAGSQAVRTFSSMFTAESTAE